MGGLDQFFRLYRRKQLGRVNLPAQASGGVYKGLECENVPHEIMLACSSENGVDAQMYIALHTTIDIDGLYDIIEMRTVADSWKRAAQANYEVNRG